MPPETEDDSNLDQFVKSLSRLTLSQTLETASDEEDPSALVQAGLAVPELLDQFRAMQVTAANESMRTRTHTRIRVCGMHWHNTARTLTPGARQRNLSSRTVMGA